MYDPRIVHISPQFHVIVDEQLTTIQVSPPPPVNASDLHLFDTALAYPPLPSPNRKH